MSLQSFSSLDVGNSDTLKSYFDFVLSTEQSGEEFPVDFDLVWPLAYSHKAEAKRALVRDFFEAEDYQVSRLTTSGKPEVGSTSTPATLTIEEIAELLMVSTRTIRRRVRAGELNPLPESYKAGAKISSQLLFSRDDVEKLARGVTPSAEMLKVSHFNSDGTFAPEEIRLTTKCLEFFIARKVRSIFEIYRQCRVAVTSAPPKARPLPPSQDTRTLERAVVDFMATRNSFDGTPMELLIELSRFVSDEQFRMADWPRSPQTFGVKINLMAPNLALRGIDLQRRKSAGLRLLRIRRLMPELR